MTVERKVNGKIESFVFSQSFQYNTM